MASRTILPANATRPQLSLMQMCTKGFYFCHSCGGATTVIDEWDPMDQERKAACEACGGHAVSWHKPSLPD